MKQVYHIVRMTRVIHEVLVHNEQEPHAKGHVALENIFYRSQADEVSFRLDERNALAE